MTYEGMVFWRWLRRKVRAQRFVQLTPWGFSSKNELAAGDNFPVLERDRTEILKLPTLH